MGSWGITALQSDIGLDAVSDIRGFFLDNQPLILSDILHFLEQDKFYAPPAEEGVSHTGILALSEIIVTGFLDRDFSRIDLLPEEKSFSEVGYFNATKQSVQWLRDYLEQTLHSAVDNAESNAAVDKWNGWFKEENWVGWQEHMKSIVDRLDTLLTFPTDPINLASDEVQAYCALESAGSIENQPEITM